MVWISFGHGSLRPARAVAASAAKTRAGFDIGWSESIRV